jgi:hypothetical protein
MSIPKELTIPSPFPVCRYNMDTSWTPASVAFRVKNQFALQFTRLSKETKREINIEVVTLTAGTWGFARLQQRARAFSYRPQTIAIFLKGSVFSETRQALQGMMHASRDRRYRMIKRFTISRRIVHNRARLIQPNSTSAGGKSVSFYSTWANKKAKRLLEYLQGDCRICSTARADNPQDLPTTVFAFASSVEKKARILELTCIKVVYQRAAFIWNGGR